jgi:hypothetical protein
VLEILAPMSRQGCLHPRGAVALINNPMGQNTTYCTSMTDVCQKAAACAFGSSTATCRRYLPVANLSIGMLSFDRHRVQAVGHPLSDGYRRGLKRFRLAAVKRNESSQRVGRLGGVRDYCWKERIEAHKQRRQSERPSRSVLGGGSEYHLPQTRPWRASPASCRAPVSIAASA